MKNHLSGKAYFRYPFAGDGYPPNGVQLLLLTEGGVCVRGIWNSSGAFYAWAPLPENDKDKERITAEKLSLKRKAN